MSNNVHIDPLTSCVICHKSEQSESNAGEVFKVNTERTCRHKFCESCTQEQFRKMGRKFKCPYPFCNSDVSREKVSFYCDNFVIFCPMTVHVCVWNTFYYSYLAERS